MSSIPLAITKILLLHSEPTTSDLIKAKVLQAFPKSLFVIAKTKAEFLEKINWIKPDIVLSAVALNDFSGLEAQVYFQTHAPAIPFMFITNSATPSNALLTKFLHTADGSVFEDQLTKLPMLLQMLSHYSKNGITPIIEKKYRTKVLLNKALAILEQTSDFQDKMIIQETLKNINHLITATP